MHFFLKIQFLTLKLQFIQVCRNRQCTTVLEIILSCVWGNYFKCKSTETSFTSYYDKLCHHFTWQNPTLSTSDKRQTVWKVVLIFMRMLYQCFQTWHRSDLITLGANGHSWLV